MNRIWQKINVKCNPDWQQYNCKLTNSCNLIIYSSGYGLMWVAILQFNDGRCREFLLKADSAENAKVEALKIVDEHVEEYQYVTYD